MPKVRSLCFRHSDDPPSCRARQCDNFLQGPLLSIESDLHLSYNVRSILVQQRVLYREIHPVDHGTRFSKVRNEGSGYGEVRCAFNACSIFIHIVGKGIMTGKGQDEVGN